MTKKQDALFLCIGSLLFLLTLLVYLLHGETILINPHDQHDSEVVSYMLRANNCLQVSFKQFMNGEAEIALPAFAQLLFYRLFPPVYAYILNMFVTRECAFWGMYLLLRKGKVQSFLAFCVGLLFALLPFYSVYGLSVMGIPLLAVCFLALHHGISKIRIIYIYILFFSLDSSIVLIGYALCILSALYTIGICLHQKQVQWRLIIAAALLVLPYLLTNQALITSLLGFSAVSHRTEVIPHALPFWSNLYNVLTYETNQYHAAALHAPMHSAILVLLLFSALYKYYPSSLKHKLRLALLTLAAILVIAVFYTAFHAEAVIRLRQTLFAGSSLVSFAFDRVFWLNPTLWYLLFGLTLSCLYDILRYLLTVFCKHLPEKPTWHAAYTGLSASAKQHVKKSAICLCFLFVACFWCRQAAEIYHHSDVVAELRTTQAERQTAVTWEHFYEPAIFSAIEAHIGQNKSDYRVVSVGLYPSIALYHGFYCVDGYSNYYHLSYKHAFQKVIAEELTYNDDLQQYFMQWGNRCYAFSAELGKNYYITKNARQTITLHYDMEQLRHMGCTYLFSAVPIGNAESLGLTWEGCFETEESLYTVYLYHIDST